MQCYDMVCNFVRRAETRTISEAHVIIFEGILALYDKSALSIMDIKIFVDTDADIRLSRRCKLNT
jgi:uridine kinase